MKREVLRCLVTLVQLLPFFFASSHYYSSGITILPFIALMYVLGLIEPSSRGFTPREFSGMEFHEVVHARRHLASELEKVVSHAVVTPLRV